MNHIYRQNCPETKRKYLGYLDVDFGVFRSHGGHIAPIRVKYGMVKSTTGPFLPAKFHPHWCKGEGTGPQTL